MKKTPSRSHGKTKSQPIIAVLGYGSQGRAVALNLHDSGRDVIVGLRPRSKSRRQAQNDGIKSVATTPAAVKQAEIVIFAFPDHLHGRVYESTIEAALRPGVTLVFLHGLSIHFGSVVPPDDADVILIAPHGPGVAVREKYVAGERSIAAFRAVQQDSSGRADRTLLDLADAIGVDRKRLIATTFADEALGDMFGEQAVLCGGLAALIKNGFDVLVENGISSENAYLEVAFQLDLIVSLIKQHGIEGMFKRISLTARYGSLETGPYLIDQGVKDRMREVFARIRNGEFVGRLEKLEAKDVTSVNRALKCLTNPTLEKAAKKFSK